MSEAPNFDAAGISWGQTVLFQALMVQLIESRVLTPLEAQRVFDLAMQRTNREITRSPDATRFVQHVHDNMRWDDLFRWHADQQNPPS